MPWDACVVEDSPDRVALKCWVRTARTPFYFEKTMTLESGSAVLKTDELLVNEGEETAHAVWGEHITIGEPFLNEDCVIDLPGGTILTHPDKLHPNSKLEPGFEGPGPGPTALTATASTRAWSLPRTTGRTTWPT